MQVQIFTIAGFKVQNKAQLLAVWHVVANDANTLAAKAEATKAQEAMQTWQRVSTWHGGKIREAIRNGELKDVMLYA